MINSINSKRTLPFGLFGLVLSLLASTMSAPGPARAQQSPGCESGIGGRIFSNGGEVEVEILPASAAARLVSERAGDVAGPRPPTQVGLRSRRGTRGATMEP